MASLRSRIRTGKAIPVVTGTAKTGYRLQASGQLFGKVFDKLTEIVGFAENKWGITPAKKNAPRKKTTAVA